MAEAILVNGRMCNHPTAIEGKWPKHCPASHDTTHRSAPAIFQSMFTADFLLLILQKGIYYIYPIYTLVYHKSIINPWNSLHHNAPLHKNITIGQSLPWHDSIWFHCKRPFGTPNVHPACESPRSSQSKSSSRSELKKKTTLNLLGPNFDPVFF